MKPNETMSFADNSHWCANEPHCTARRAPRAIGGTVVALALRGELFFGLYRSDCSVHLSHLLFK
jgi:hypothetical protein